jgi:MFS family permease
MVGGARRVRADPPCGPTRAFAQLNREAASDLAKAAPRASQRGLDWFTFFVADIQTGFGPFLSVYLTAQKWTQVDIGLILSIGSVAGLLGQVPGGWLVDLARSKRRAAGLAVVAIGVSALLIAVAPMFAAMVAAKLLHVGASSVLGPAVAAITLGLVGHAAVAQRLGRNARFAAVGNGLAAAIMGACGYFISPQAVFFVTAVLAFPAVLALAHIREADIDPVRADGGNGVDNEGESHTGVGRLLRKSGFLTLTLCVLLFHLANAAMLPLVGSDVTMRSSQWATALVAACIIAPQLVVAAISPTVGELAQNWGRRPLLLLGFAVLPLRGALLAWTKEPYMIVAVQALDGLSGAVLGVLVPLTLADLSRGTGRFNLAQGIVGCATGIGAALSTAGAGYLADRFGTSAAFAGLASIAILALAVVALLMPETRPNATPTLHQ